MLITILTRQQKEGKMTDEQIIIDGIDVSKCEFLIINNDCFGGY